MVSQPLATDLPLLQVADTRLALGQLSARWRRASKAPLIAITGSNGKTTLKEMLAAILGQRASVLATRGNLNNDIGVPLTLARLQEQAYAVVEMGANHAGEIDYLSRLAEPDVAVLNNAGRSHLEGFGSVEGVARAKGEIVNGLSRQGCFVFNADDDWAGLWRELARDRQILTFGVQQPADVSSPVDSYALSWRPDGFIARFPVITPQGEIEINLPLAGGHNRMNALAAIAAAQAVGIGLDQIAAGLVAVKPVKGRLQSRPGMAGIGLIDDSYNANPDSVGAAIAVLATAPGRRILVLGELAELGDATPVFYRELGEQAAAAGIELLYGAGAAAEAAQAFGPKGEGFGSREALIEQLLMDVRGGDRVLVKGSRSAGMEHVINALAAGEAD
jgi:UDP-N-acetylmuramoyl-tripeptide--D-alanyl-D-alanine ligase